jgi:large subunit ribosomal protein L22
MVKIKNKTSKKGNHRPKEKAKADSVKKTNLSQKKPDIIKAKLRFLRMSPKKVRLVTDLVKGMKAIEAIDYLKFVNKAAVTPVTKLINSAIANAINNFNLEKDNLYIKNIVVNQGPTLRRWKPRAHGRATPIRKRSSHVEVILVQKSEKLAKKGPENKKSNIKNNKSKSKK